MHRELGRGRAARAERLESASLPTMHTVFLNQWSARPMRRWRGAIAPALVVVGRADPPVHRRAANRPPPTDRAEPGLSSARTGDGI